MPRNKAIQHFRGTAANWASSNPVLLAGEIGFETDTNRVKMGDGVTAWDDLPYLNANTAPITKTFTYTGEQLTEIARADGEILTLSYTGDKLTEIQSSRGWTKTFAYSGDTLVSITVTYP